MKYAVIVIRRLPLFWFITSIRVVDRDLAYMRSRDLADFWVRQPRVVEVLLVVVQRCLIGPGKIAQNARALMVQSTAITVDNGGSIAKGDKVRITEN